MTTQKFADRYLDLWKTTDSQEREQMAKALFAEDAVHHAAPANLSFVGRDQILANIASVNKEAIQKAGLKFKTEASTGNHNAILYEWSAEAPNGRIVRTGRDLMILNDQGKIKALYMFTSN
jgi:hypothetical protein